MPEIGAVRGFHADVDPAWIGRPIQAMIAVRLRSDAREAIGRFAESLAGLPAVRDVYFVSGSYDFLPLRCSVMTARRSSTSAQATCSRKS